MNDTNYMYRHIGDETGAIMRREYPIALKTIKVPIIPCSTPMRYGNYFAFYSNTPMCYGDYFAFYSNTYQECKSCSHYDNCVKVIVRRQNFK